MQIVAGEHVLATAGRQELWDRMPSPEQSDAHSRDRVAGAIDYTVESANLLAEELRAIPPKDPAKRKLDKQGMVRLLAAEIMSLQQRGYTIEEVAAGLRGRGFAITTPTLKNYLQRAKSIAEKRTRNGARPASGGSGSEAPKMPKRDSSNRPEPATTQVTPAAKPAASLPEAGAAPEDRLLRSGKGAFLVKDKDSY